MAETQMLSRRYGRIYRKMRKYTSRREVLISTYLILSLFTVSFFAVVFIRPTAITIAELWREIQDKKSVSSKLESKINDLEKAQSLYVSIKDDLDFLNRALPSDSDFSRFVNEMEYLSSSHNLIFSGATYGKIVVYSSDEATPSSAELVTYPLSYSFQGSFSQIISFLKDFESLDRIITIGSISVSPIEDRRKGVYILSLSISSSIYSLSEGPI